MHPEEMVRRGLAKRFEASRDEIEELLRLAERDLLLAGDIRNQSLDWAEIVAYNSMLQSGRALMLHRGHRPSGESHHLAVISFLESELGVQCHELVLSMMNLRKKRNISLYSRAGSVSEAEVERAMLSAAALKEFVKHIVLRTG